VRGGRSSRDGTTRPTLLLSGAGRLAKCKPLLEGTNALCHRQSLMVCRLVRLVWSRWRASVVGLSVLLAASGTVLPLLVDAAGAHSATRKVSAFPGRNGLIAYRGSQPGVRNSIAIYAVKPDGTGQRRLSGYGAWYNPAWSPDGRRLIVEHIIEGTAANDDSIYLLRPAADPEK
jgi:hypothetical protein